jgi:hypothetical protein
MPKMTNNKKLWWIISIVLGVLVIWFSIFILKSAWLIALSLIIALIVFTVYPFVSRR